ncbi:hypothetical protein TeGR_g3379 [Tetraparma gracilis]|uniref:Choline/carnitine acyltransferase domain-containing protein n=1 Tax=Tetraparma gracilis TaxID=2962635 RepID=A0ABQ6M506_9STRA|nr:hypothetical protein TeGR_g3379 [Tetraparma gracilis]
MPPPNLPRWRSPSYISRGDYLSDALSLPLTGPLYANEPALPSLPVPSLEETLATLQDSTLAVATDAEKPQLRKDLASFAADGGAALQALLLARAERLAGSSWLQEWWNTQGYLIPRDPVPVNVSYFFQFKDDGSAADGCARAAALLFRAGEFRKRVVTGTLEADALGKKRAPLCAAAWKYMFNGLRLPKSGHDEFVMHDPALHNHVAVMCEGVIFSFDFVDENHDPLPVAALECLLRSCAAQAKAAGESAAGKPPCVGVLSSQERDAFAGDYEHLLTVHPSVPASMDILASAALLVNLDSLSPVSNKCASPVFWHGKSPSPNRYFDKPVQIIVAENGKAGLLGEHAMMDGMPMVRLADYIASASYAEVAAAKPAAPWVQPEMAAGVPRQIFEPEAVAAMGADAALGKAVERAKASFEKLTGEQELEPVTYAGYGASYMKASKISPDAFVQMAIQLATTRLFGKSVGTYEASQVRTFRHGRTETTRSCSTASVRFAAAMRGGGQPPEVKAELLRQAARRHVEYLGKAGAGKGVDRHMFGLSMLQTPGTQRPALFDNPAFKRAKTWTVSTSHLTHPKFDNWGWGEVVPDGVGVAYSIHPGKCVFNVTARREKDLARPLGHYLQEALEDMRAVLEAEKKKGGGGKKSKL